MDYFPGYDYGDDFTVDYSDGTGHFDDDDAYYHDYSGGAHLTAADIYDYDGGADFAAELVVEAEHDTDFDHNWGVPTDDGNFDGDLELEVPIDDGNFDSHYDDDFGLEVAIDDANFEEDFDDDLELEVPIDDGGSELEIPVDDDDSGDWRSDNEDELGYGEVGEQLVTPVITTTTFAFWEDEDDYNGGGNSRRENSNSPRIHEATQLRNSPQTAASSGAISGSGEELRRDRETSNVVQSVEENEGVMIGGSAKKEETEKPSSSGHNKSDGSEIDGVSCPICMEPWTSDGEHAICCLPCGHLYGMSCIKSWLRQPNSGKCPQCNKISRVEDIRKIYGLTTGAKEKELQEKIQLLEAKCASLELKDADWRRKEAEWTQMETLLLQQLKQDNKA